MTLVVAGAGGDSGKTLVSLGLAAAWRERGLDVRAFKKGPDYIDAAWLTRASGRPARNLDAWIMGDEAVARSFERHASSPSLALVEGNRGLFDGLDGTSTAALAKLLGAAVVIVLDVTKTTKTAAAFVAGCKVLDPELDLAGVLLNRVAGARHRREATAAVETLAEVPVLGAIPRLRGDALLPDRHLGLVPPEEHRRMGEVTAHAATVLEEHADVERLGALAEAPVATSRTPSDPRPARRARIGVFRDAAFTFYYPENLEALEAAGAELVPISALEDASLPSVDALYLGGGFPETQAPRLAENRSQLQSVREAAATGLPIYAECGGLIYLANRVTYDGGSHSFAGVFDLDIEVCSRPQGHGYAEAVVDRANPFFPEGAVLRGHEFHYARIGGGRLASTGSVASCLALRRGRGNEDGRDGLVRGNVFASWIHLHALGTSTWAAAMVDAAERH